MPLGHAGLTTLKMLEMWNEAELAAAVDGFLVLGLGVSGKFPFADVVEKHRIELQTLHGMVRIDVDGRGGGRR